MSETWYIVYESDTGKCVSIGTIVADPLPSNLSVVSLSEGDSSMLLNGKAYWNEATLSVIENVPVVPETITARQVRLWLVQHGISLQSVTDAINTIEDPILRNSIGVEWEYAPYIERNHPMLIPLSQTLGLNESDINRAFIEASNF